jgi:2-octaprenylphenol hydroxylase
MVGLSLALALAETGLSLTLIDNQPALPQVATLQGSLRQPGFDSRVSAITPASQRFLHKLGVWQSLSELRISPYRDMQVWDADGTGAVHFAAEDVHAPWLGHIVENRLLSAVLSAALQQAPRLRLLLNDAVDSVQPAAGAGSSPLLTLKSGTPLQCKLLIGADGGNSVVRREAGFATREWSYEQQAVVCTVRTEKPHAATAWQRFMSSGPLAFLPLYLPDAVEQHYSSIVWSCDTAFAQELMALPDEMFATRLGQAFEHRLGAIESVSTRHAFPLQQQHARDYVQPGLALVGDAAHTIHPLAGQGVNLGFADAECLAQVIQAAMQRGEDFASLQTLSRYQRQRKGENLGMMLGMEAFKRAFGSDELAIRWLRNTGLKIADGNRTLKQMLIKRAMGLSL